MKYNPNEPNNFSNDHSNIQMNQIILVMTIQNVQMIFQNVQMILKEKMKVKRKH
jgi:hypothetical protein